MLSSTRCDQLPIETMCNPFPSRSVVDTVYASIVPGRLNSAADTLPINSSVPSRRWRRIMSVPATAGGVAAAPPRPPRPPPPPAAGAGPAPARALRIIKAFEPFENANEPTFSHDTTAFVARLRSSSFAGPVGAGPPSGDG
jgi:hypothetical protein